MTIFNFQFSIFKLLFLIVLLIAMPLSCKAVFWGEWFEDLFGNEEFDSVSTNSTEVINEIKVEANTGGNTADEDEVIEGEEKTSVEIRTIINGEEIEPIDIESSASEIEVESRIEVEQGKEPVMERKIQINNEPVEIPDESGNQASVKNRGVIKELWSDFVENLKSIFLGIFNIFR